MHRRINRADGSVIILIPRHESKSVTWELMFKIGSRQERPSINGVSHFIEHLMFKGTKKRPNTKAITKELDAVGASYNAFTAKDHTGYYVQTDADHIKLGIDILSDMLRHSIFDPKEMNRERNVIIEELNMYRDNPTMRIEEIFETCLFGRSPLGWEIGGPREVIAKIPHADLVAFKNKFYYPGNMVIGLAGNFKEAEAVRLANTYFPLRTAHKHKASIRPLLFAPLKPKVLIEKKDTEQIQLMLGFPGYRRKHKNSDALFVLSVIIGGTMSSRLFINIRERLGLAYSVQATSESYEDVGYFAVHAGLDKSRIEEAITAIRKELDRVVAKGVTREEFQRARDNIKGRLILRFENPSSYLSYLLSQELLTQGVDDLDVTLERINNVKIADVHRVARELIVWKKAHMALIGPFTDKEKFRKLIAP